MIIWAFGSAYCATMQITPLMGVVIAVGGFLEFLFEAQRFERK